MCYYHSCVQYLKLIVLYWNFLLLCVWTDICTLYLFYVSEINIYYYYYYYINLFSKGKTVVFIQRSIQSVGPLKALYTFCPR